MRSAAMIVCLWIAVITIAISIGGNVFQSVVVDPLWSASPPDSVRAFSGSPLLRAVARFHINPLYAVGLLCLLATPVLAWDVPELRKWLLLAIAFQLVVIVGTVLYFYPINKLLFFQGGEGLNAARITALTRRWILADRLRLILRFGTFLCLLRAMMLSRIAP